jgi:hypothetical protein
MLKLSCNDLIGLRYRWAAAPSDGTGYTDCFQLVCEIRNRLGLKDYKAQFAWVYNQYTEAAFRKALLPRWLLQNGTRLQERRHGAVVLLPAAIGSALGTIVEDDALFISPRGAVVRTPLPQGVGHHFWMNE